MRVAFDLTAAPTRLAGAGHYMVELVSALARTGRIALDVLAKPVHVARVQQRAPTARVLESSSRIRPVRLAWEQTGLPLRLRRLRPDVLHSPHYTMPMWSPVPVVVTFHDATFFTHPELHERVKVAFFRQSMRLAARRASRIVAVSETTRDGILAHLRVDPDRIDVVHEGVDLEELSPPSQDELDAFRRRRGLTRPWIAFIGTLEPRKNVPRLLDAFSRLADDWPGDLVVAGRLGWGSEGLGQALARVPAGRVHRLGYVADDERRCLLGGAELVCYPSLAEGFGLPVIEAMACGAAVVTSATSATGEVAGDAAELVDPEDTASLERGMRRVLDDDGLRTDLQERGRARAARFTWDRTAEAMLEVYRKALG